MIITNSWSLYSKHHAKGDWNPRPCSKSLGYVIVKSFFSCVMRRFLPSRRKHVIERIIGNTGAERKITAWNQVNRACTTALPDALDPALSFVVGGRAHSVKRVTSLHYFALRVCFAGLDDVIRWRVQFEAVWLVSVADFADLDVFKRNYSLWLFVLKLENWSKYNAKTWKWTVEVQIECLPSCTQNSRDNCRSIWTIFASSFCICRL